MQTTKYFCMSFHAKMPDFTPSKQSTLW